MFPDVPRDEIVEWLYWDFFQEEDEDEEVVDASPLFEQLLIDAGITSGADSSGWEPIDISSQE